MSKENFEKFAERIARRNQDLDQLQILAQCYGFFLGRLIAIDEQLGKLTPEEVQKLESGITKTSQEPQS